MTCSLSSSIAIILLVSNMRVCARVLMESAARRGDRNDMLATAQVTSPAGVSSMKSTLVNMEAPMATS